MRKVNALLGHWMGGINPCICMRCKDVAAYVADAVAQAVKERDAYWQMWVDEYNCTAQTQAEENARLRQHVDGHATHGGCSGCKALRAPGQP